MPVESNLSTQIGIFANKTKRNMEYYIKDICRDFSEEIIETAPCDTGAYIGNWTPSIDSPKTSNDFVPGLSQYKGRGRSSKFRGAMSGPNREKATSFVRNKLNYIIPLLTINNTFYFSNGVRHAVYVEYGGGATPPYAIVRRAMYKFKRKLEQSVTFGSGAGSNVARSGFTL
jgi:hypothetical protein